MSLLAFQTWMETNGELFIICLAGLCFLPMILGGDK